MAFLMIDEAAACMTFSLWVSRSQILQDTGFLEISAIIVSSLKKKGAEQKGESLECLATRCLAIPWQMQSPILVSSTSKTSASHQNRTISLII